MATTFKIDSSEYEKAVKEFGQVSSRALPEILNRSAKSVAIKAYQWTKSASRRKMQAEFHTRRLSAKGKVNEVKVDAKGRKYVGLKVVKTTDVSKLKAKKKVGKLKFKMGWVYSKKILGGVAKKTGLSGSELYKATASYVGKAISSAGYIKHGWTSAIVGFGGKPPSSKFMQTHPYGNYRKAYPDEKPMAMIENSANGAEPVTGPALQIAFDQETMLLRDEIRRRLSGESKKRQPKEVKA
jgi:hypothetical protein